MKFGKWQIKVICRNKVNTLVLVNELDKIIIDVPKEYMYSFGYDENTKKMYKPQSKDKLYELVNEILTNHIVWITSMRASAKTVQKHLLHLSEMEKVEATKKALIKVANIVPKNLLAFKNSVCKENETTYEEMSNYFK